MPAREGGRAAEPPPRRGLAVPTAKAGAALAAAVAVAAAIGAGIGLPLPLPEDDGPGVPRVAAASGPLLEGIAPGIYNGPFHPVAGPAEYGESDARFGAPRGGRLHEGQDVFAKAGTPVVAVRDGIAIERNGEGGHDYGGGGNYITIYSPIERRSYVYLHMLKTTPIELGQRVDAGQVVGQVGCTGSCYGNHLHFEIRRGKASWGADTKAIDPLPFLKKWPRAKLKGA